MEKLIKRNKKLKNMPSLIKLITLIKLFRKKIKFLQITIWFIILIWSRNQHWQNLIIFQIYLRLWNLAIILLNSLIRKKHVFLFYTHRTFDWRYVTTNNKLKSIYYKQNEDEQNDWKKEKKRKHFECLNKRCAMK